jgi:beta-alanine--pyruvate transaminase
VLLCDEVITGVGRLGRATASEFFGIEPDIMVLAKGVTNGSVPMGATAVTAAVHDAVVEGAAAGIELFHGYTYSGHPLACAAALATLETYAEEGLFQRGAQLSGHWEAAVHSLAGEPNVIDVRNIGLMGAVELAPRADGPGLRGPAVFQHCFDNGLLVRASGDTIAMSPPLIVSENQIDEAIEGLRAALRACP